jgi:hypothetical protein
MHNAAARNTVSIATRSRTFSLLDFLLAGARGDAVATPAAACPELAVAGGACCAGNGTTASAYLAPERIEWFYSGPTYEGYQAPVTYARRCRY